MRVYGRGPFFPRFGNGLTMSTPIRTGGASWGNLNYRFSFEEAFAHKHAVGSLHSTNPGTPPVGPDPDPSQHARTRTACFRRITFIFSTVWYDR